MRRDKTFYDEFHRLEDAGFKPQKVNQIRENSGSETIIHLASKAAAFRILAQEGYAVSSEVECPDGEVDILAFGHPERLTYAVELEHSFTEQNIKSKLNRYVHSNDVVDDMLAVNINEAPTDILELEEWMREELGL